MSPSENLPAQRSILVAITVSLGLHLLVLFFPTRTPPETQRYATRLEASLTPRPSALPAPSAEIHSEVPAAATSQTRRAAQRPHTPQWTVAQKNEMNRFLSELDEQAKKRPSLAQRALAQARMIAVERNPGKSKEEFELVERIPNSPPINDFSLEMYFDSLLKKLNKSAAYVRNDPRSRGLKTAVVMVRIAPDGSLNSFQVLNEADQQDEIRFLRSVVERAVPFAAFPPDMRRSAQTVGLLICVQPAGARESGFGFLRMVEGTRC
ncbi:MAG: hypothetical protein WCK63_11410 [Betaproteobacteria bacterium]